MILELKNRTRFTNNRLAKCYPKFGDLISELKTKSLNDTMTSFINSQIELINRNQDEKSLLKQVRSSQHKIIKKLEKEHKIVPKNYYRNLWMVLGMSAFGIPLGAAFGASISNMAFLGAGMPIGMAIGIAVGTQKDQEAAKNGRQLNFQTSY